MAEQQNKRLKFSKNHESSGGKKSPGRSNPCRPVATMAPAAPSPVYTRMPTLAAPSTINKAKPTIVAVRSAATSPSAATAPALVSPSPVSTKTTPALAVVKQEDGWMVEQAVAAEEQAVDGLTAKNKRWLHCAACSVALKPPVSMCGAGHAVCCVCAGANKHCGECDSAATYTQVPCMDGLVGTLELPCPYQKFGCGTSMVYHAVAEHKARCGHAPCYCFGCTPLFRGSPASLVRHFTEESGRHRWPAPEKIEYGTKQSLVVPASSSEHRRLLLAEKDGGVFLLALGAGRGAAGIRPVTMVCVRGNTGDRTRPVYTGTIKVTGPPDEQNDSAILLLQAKMTSCAFPGHVNMEHGRLRGHVIPEMLHGESKEVHLDVCVEDP